MILKINTSYRYFLDEADLRHLFQKAGFIVPNEGAISINDQSVKTLTVEFETHRELDPEKEQMNG